MTGDGVFTSKCTGDDLGMVNLGMVNMALDLPLTVTPCLIGHMESFAKRWPMGGSKPPSQEPPITLGWQGWKQLRNNTW